MLIIMRTILPSIVSFVLTCSCAVAGESGVTYTIQALTGLVGDTPRFVQVYCHDRYVMSGEPTAFPLICAPNIPPTNSPAKLEDHNLLSASGLKIHANRKNDALSVVLDATTIKIPDRLYSGTEEEIIRMAFECIRMTAALGGVKSYSLELDAPKRLSVLAPKLLEDFTKHDKAKPFVHHPAEQ